MQPHPESVETVIVGGGQAGLAMAYELQRRGRPSVILDANARTGDSWRQRWDTLRLFTPAKLSHLPGMPYPDEGWAFPTKDAFADYLEAYVREFELDVRHESRADRLERHGERYLVTAGEQRIVADQVILATGGYQEPKVPVFAPDLAPEVLQLHSSAYRNPSQVQDGAVLVVGAGNSGAEIALELAPGREVYLSGRAPVFPTRPGSLPSRVAMPLFFFAATRLLTIKTPIGRRIRPRVQHHAAPVLRARPRDLERAGVRRVGRVAGVHEGVPTLEDGSALEVANVIWCTGFRTDFSWIDLPAFASGDEPAHERGVLTDEPGIYLVGQKFQYALASTFIGGVGRDASYLADVIARRVRERTAEAPRAR